MLSAAQRCARSAAPRHVGASRGSSRLPVVRVRAASDDAFANFTPTVAAFFPGQGAQTVGMAKELCEGVPAAKALFDKASEILGYDLLQVCVEGPKEKLDTTAVSQPAIYVASLAAVEKLRATEGQAAIDAIDVAAGLSLGEYTALAFAGAIKFEDGLRLVKLRGESMQAAADAVKSGMVSVVGLSSDKVAELCAAATADVGADKPVKIANFLCPGNYAVSGSIEGCDVVVARGKEFKARMTVRLSVAGAFHTEYMSPAVAALKEALAATEISVPRIPVVSNVDARPHSDPDVIRDILSRQVTSPVLWENTMTDLFEKGLSKSYEIGPNKVIAGIVKRIKKEHEITNISA
ncbi:hypothetical protein FOA52_003565 [Chlamydomonas sp. UWO 241]|nr:hypothetical protein FOA52_003565 [Chlamydomonas sp. UWO 241]